MTWVNSGAETLGGVASCGPGQALLIDTLAPVRLNFAFIAAASRRRSASRPDWPPASSPRWRSRLRKRRASRRMQVDDTGSAFHACDKTP
jgi:hypothetical protein